MLSSSSVSLESSNSASIKSTSSFSLAWICTVRNILEDNFLHVFLERNQHNLLYCKNNEFFLWEFHCVYWLYQHIFLAWVSCIFCQKLVDCLIHGHYVLIVCFQILLNFFIISPFTLKNDMFLLPPSKYLINLLIWDKIIHSDHTNPPMYKFKILSNVVFITFSKFKSIRNNNFVLIDQVSMK